MNFFLCHLKVIKPESCVPCGKRIKFGKISLKCRDCRVVSHPECRERCPLPCIPNLGATPVKIGEVCENVFKTDFSRDVQKRNAHYFHLSHCSQFTPLLMCFQGVLADYVPDSSPMIPPLVVHCVNEIEQRGMHEVSAPIIR